MWGHAQFWPRGARWRGVQYLLVIFGGYAAALFLSIKLAPDGVALLWLPNAVLVTALLGFRQRDWPYVYAAGLLAQMIAGLMFQGVALYDGLYIGAVNAVEATLLVLCAALIAGGRRLVGLFSIRGALALIVASVTVPALTGAFGAMRLARIFNIDYFETWRDWWFGDSLGLLVGVPVGLLLRDVMRSIARRRSVAVIVLGGGAATLLGVASAILATDGNTWAAQQIAIAAAVVLAWALGAVGGAVAAALLMIVTLIGVTDRPDGLAFLVRDQTLLFVVVAAIYTIAAATESAHRAMGQSARAGDDLQAANVKLASLLEATPDALIIVGTDGRIAFANTETGRMFGYPKAELVGCKVEALLPQRFHDRHVQDRAGFFANPVVRPMGTGLQLRGLRRDGSEFPVSIRLSPLRTEESVNVLAAIRDVSERHEYEQRLRRDRDDLMETQQELRRLANFDALTGLVNRGAALARLESALACSRTPGPEFGVLFCDVDHFKSINDTYGHAAGDAVLRTVAERITQCVRHGDTVGRTGGDEILVLLPGLHNLEEASQIAEKIRAHCAEAIRHSGSTLLATLSIGASLAIPGESVSDLTARADAAMYQSKRLGGNAVTCI